LLVAGSIDQDTAHGLGSGGKKIAYSWPSFDCFASNEPEICFMDQSRRLQRLAWLFLGELTGRLSAPLIVHQRQTLGRRLRIALVYRGQNARNIGHAINRNSEIGSKDSQRVRD
jgi:hypothetical protein